MSIDARMVDIAQLNTLQEAYMIKMKLELAGIISFIPDEFTAQTLPIFGGSSQGYRVQVYLKDSLKAMDVLYEDHGENENIL